MVARSLQRPKGITAQAAGMVEYFSVQNTVSRDTGRVDALFRAWADLKGVDCAECQRLGQLFSRVVDSAKSGECVEISKVLSIPRERRSVASSESRFVWQRMEFAAEEFARDQEERQSAGGMLLGAETIPVYPSFENDDEFLEDSDNPDDNFLFNFVARNHLAMLEFTKFRLVMQHLDNDLDAFFESEFANYVNFALFTSTECGFAVEKYGVPPYLLDNALRCHSHLLRFRPSFVEKYTFDGTLPWKFYWRSESDSSTVSFPKILAHALRQNTDALLLAEAPDSVVIILRFSRHAVRSALSEAFLTGENLESGCMGKHLKNFMEVHAYFISGHFGFQESYSLEGPIYQLDLSEDGLQLYRRKRAQTFVHLKVLVQEGHRSQNTTTTGRAKLQPAGENDSPSIQISVDLTRFNRRILGGSRRHPFVRKTRVTALEVFVHNRLSDYSAKAARGISYLDVLIEDDQDFFHVLHVADEDILDDDDTIDNLMPTGTDLLLLYNREFSDLTALLEAPEVFLKSFVSLLQRTCQQFGLCTGIPQKIREAVISLAELVLTDVLLKTEAAKRVLIVTEIAALLAYLNIDVALPLCKGYDDQASDLLPAFVATVRRWDVWLSLGSPDKCDDMLRWLKEQINVSLLDAKLQFVYRNASEQANVFLSELRDGSPDYRSSSAALRMGNLRLDPAQPFWVESEADFDCNEVACEEDAERRLKTMLPTITFYRVHSIPQRFNFTVGEYVCISQQTDSEKKRGGTGVPLSNVGYLTQHYEEDFPLLTKYGSKVKETSTGKSFTSSCDLVSKSGRFCLGRVVSMCEAPFSISMKLVAPSFSPYAAPEFLLKCLSVQPAVYWEVSVVPANVVTHVRNIDAISTFLGSTSKACVAPELLPYLLLGTFSNDGQPSPVFDEEYLALHREVDCLNERQNDAVRWMLKERLSLVHGPGGTGKIFDQRSKNRDYCILTMQQTYAYFAFCFLLSLR